MRFAVGVLACFGAGATFLAVADPPAPSPAPTTTAPATAAPAAAPAAAASSSAAANAAARPATAPQVDPFEKHFLAEGYKLEMHNGQKMFCRSEEVLGSRIGGKRLCSTLEQLKASETATREEIERVQRTIPSPTGK